MIEPGLHLALSRDGYEQIDAPNISRLKHLRRSPAHARHALLHPEPPTQAQELGQAVHLAVLERDRWEREYIAAPPCDRRTKEGKAIWAEAMNRAEGRTILRGEEYELCADLAAAVWSHPVAAEILRGKGVNEASLIWREGDGMAKCRLDALRMISGRGCAIDLKTTVDASPKGFAREIARMDYHAQAGWYTLGLERVFGAPHRWLWIAVEKEPPYAVAVYELAHDDLMLGRETALRWLEQWRACERSGIWPGYSDAIQSIQLPAWARASEPYTEDSSHVVAF